MKVVLYHAYCPDGFGAALAAWKVFGDDGRYIPVCYGQEPPFAEIVEASADELYIVDFSYDRQTLRDLKQLVDRVIVIDHHISAQQALEGWSEPGIETVFDMSKSGACLAWEYFHPGTEVPELLRYVQDRDLWRWELPDSREVAAALSSYPQDFEIWDTQLDVARLATEGRVILRFQNRRVQALADKAYVGRIGDYEGIPMCNGTLFWSEVGEELLSRYPDAPFVVVYGDRSDGKRSFSLRSRGVDVARVAQEFGGGGHRQASGFELAFEGGEVRFEGKILQKWMLPADGDSDE